MPKLDWEDSGHVQVVICAFFLCLPFFSFFFRNYFT